MDRENLDKISSGLIKLFDEMNSYLYNSELQRPTFKYSNNMSAQKWRCEKNIGDSDVTYTYVVPFSQIKKEKIITEVDRLGRNKKQIVKELMYFKKAEIRTIFLELPTTFEDLKKKFGTNELAGLMYETMAEFIEWCCAEK